jgi:hypothetical protein
MPSRNKIGRRKLNDLKRIEIMKNINPIIEV